MLIGDMRGKMLILSEIERNKDSKTRKARKVKKSIRSQVPFIFQVSKRS